MKGCFGVGDLLVSGVVGIIIGMATVGYDVVANSEVPKITYSQGVTCG